MKFVVKKVVKTLLVLVVSSITIYLIFTISAFYTWCSKNQISMFFHSDELLSYLDRQKIQELGDTIGNFAQLMEDSKNDDYSLAKIYDPLGYSVWSYLQMGIGEALTKYITISIFSGIAIAVAYIVITSKKMKPILKLAIGYFGVILIIPPIYMYTWTYRFWGIVETYKSMPKYFYIGYTAIFVLMYMINYRMGIRMTKQLNETLKKDK